MTDYVYMVTATTEHTTFNWVYDNATDAQRLFDMGKEIGGDVYWECFPYTTDISPEEAIAEFMDYIRDDIGEAA